LQLQGNQSEADEETIQIFKTAYQTSGWQGVLGEQARQFEAGNYVYFHGAGSNGKVGNFEWFMKSQALQKA